MRKTTVKPSAFKKAMTRLNQPSPNEQKNRVEGAHNANEDGPLRADEESHKLEIANLIAQVQKMVKESGDPTGFDTKKWVVRWNKRPLPALGGRRPEELLNDPDGRALVSNIIARIHTGAYL